MQLIHTYIWALWDLLAVGIFFHRVRKCANLGFVSTVIRLLVYVVAVAAAYMTYLKLADFLYENVVQDAVKHVLTSSFNNMINGISPAADTVRALPMILRLMIGFKSGEVAAIPITDADSMSAQVMDMALKSPIMSLLHGAGFLLIFTVVAYAMRYIARLFTGINRVPVIGTLNTVAGGIVGVAEGLIVLFISGFILRMLIAISGEVWWWLNTSVIHSTYIWRLFF